MSKPNSDTRSIVDSYYAAWTRGSCDAAALAEVLAPDLHFRGPMAGERTGREPFVEAVKKIASMALAHRPSSLVVDGPRAVAIYELDLTPPRKTTRFAETFIVEGGRITALEVIYDPSGLRMP